MRPSPWLLLAVLSGANAYHLARRVDQSLKRATYEGGWPLSVAGKCPQAYSTACGSTTDVNQVCCPTGNTCFGTIAYCCPTGQDCTQAVSTFPVCVDPAANMFHWGGNSYFCCEQGLTGVMPITGLGFCQDSDVSVPVSLLATMASQFGGTSVTPFGYGPTTATAGASTQPVVAGSTGAQTVAAGSSTRSVVAGASPTTPGTSPATSPSTSITSSTSTFSIPTVAGIAGGVFILFIIFCCISRKCWKQARSSSSDKSYLAGPPVLPVLPAYLPQGDGRGIYAPTPLPPFNVRQNVYDPVLERGAAVSPLIPENQPPRYEYATSHELGQDGQGAVGVQEAHGLGSLGGRVEMG